MRDSALKPHGVLATRELDDVGEELMRDSALKRCAATPRHLSAAQVGEELMRDSALKLERALAKNTLCPRVGEELMRDSALKQAEQFRTFLLLLVGEELMRDSALKL